jgi:adenosylhomocysteine nucleosidase
VTWFKSKDQVVLICFALKEEAAPFQKMAAGKSGISILITGIGRQNAEKAVREFLAALGIALASGAASDALVAGIGGRAGKPDDQLSTRNIRHEGVPEHSRGGCAPQLVLTCGFAGGLNPDLKLGEVVFEISESQPSTFNLQLSTRLLAAGAKPAKFFCADRIATTIVEKKKLRIETGADAVEMESEAIHAVCREHGIPCATVRVISDIASEDLPLDFNVLAKPDSSLDYGKLFWVVAKSPWKIGGLLRLQKNCRFAAERLAEVLAKITFP